MSDRFDLVVIGGGIVGLSTALQLLGRRPGLCLALLEKEPELATHQTGHNSGVLHAGLYYRPGSLKARLCREGKLAVERFADEHAIPYEHRGKVVIALDGSELPRLAELERRGVENGVEGLRMIGPEELRELEPHVGAIRALHSPKTGVIDFRRVALAYADDVRARGGEILRGREATLSVRYGGAHEVQTGRRAGSGALPNRLRRPPCRPPRRDDWERAPPTTGLSRFVATTTPSGPRRVAL